MKREYRLTRQKGIRLLRAIRHPQNKSHARLCAMVLASTLSCMVMASTTFSTSALAAAKEKIDTFDTSSISELVQAGAQGLQSGADTLIQDAKQLSALSEEAAPVVNDDAIVVQDGTVIIQGDTTTSDIRATMQGTGKDATEVLFKNQITITTTVNGAFQSATSLQQVRAEPGAKVSFAGASSASAPSLGYFFSGCTNLESIDGLSAWDASNVTGRICMEYMFYNCSNLASLNALSAWDVSNVTGESCMNNMFYGCSKLTSLDGLSAWDVSNVTDDSCMQSMFSGCTNLASLDGLSAWDVSKVTGNYCMQSMFYGCSELTSLDGLSAWDVSNVTGAYCMSYMFSGCSKLTSLDGLSAWDVSNVTRSSCMESMFSGCSNLTSIDALANWKITNALGSTDGVKEMFSGCSNIASITLGGKDGFKLSDAMSLPVTTTSGDVYWWPVDNTSATTGIDTAALVTKSQEDNPQYMRWQRCTSGSSDPTIDVSTLQVEWPVTNLTYTGLLQTIKPTSVMADGTSLTPGRDFYVNYTKGTTTTDAMKDAGTYTATVNLRGAYRGNPVTEEIAIAKLNLAQADNRPEVYTVPSECPYTGSPITPETMVRVNVGSLDSPRYAYLVENTADPEDPDYDPTDGDYTVTYANNVVPGEATAIVKPATSNPNLEGETSAKFQILFPPDASAYVARDTGGETLTFSYSTEQPSGTEGSDWWKIEDNYDYLNTPGWLSDDVTTVEFDDSFKFYKPTSTAYWFEDLLNLETITNTSNLTATSVTDMQRMFSGCTKLQSLDLSSFETPSLTNLSFTFSRCSSLETLTLGPKFNTSKVTMFASLFNSCEAFTDLDISMFNTGSATSMANMFASCDELQTLKLGKSTKLRTDGQTTGLRGLEATTSSFWRADMETQINYNINDWKASSTAFNDYLTNMSEASHTFTYSTMRLTYNGNGGKFGTDQDAPTTSYLYGNKGDVIIKTDGVPFDHTPKPINQGYNFVGYATSSTSTEVATPTEFPAPISATEYYAIWNKAAYVAKSSDSKTLTFTTRQPSGTEGTDWWKIADSYTAAPGWTTTLATKVEFDSSFAAYEPTSVAYWFYNLGDLSSVSGLSYLKGEQISSVAHMYEGCKNLSNPALPDSVSAETLTDFTALFKGCTKQTTSGLPANFTVSATDTLTSLYEGCSTLKTLDLTGFTTTATTSMANMFKGTNLTKVILPKTFQFATGSEFDFTASATTNFWIADIQTKMGDMDGWNSYLQALSDSTPHTFTRASITLTFEAQDGQFGSSTSAQKQAFLYGNANAAIAEAELPIPSRDGYDFAGYAATATGDVIEITAFPAINTSYYAVYSQAAWMLYNGSGELTLSYGAKPTPGTGGSVWQVADDYSASNRPGWTDYEVTKVTIDDSVKNGYKPKSMAYWFSNMPAATAKIVNLASLDTSAVTTMEATFAGFAKNATSALTAPDLSKFDTQNVSNMASMFKGCSAFETLNISSFNTQNTENFSEMFSGATRLTTLDTSKLISSKAQTMASMFEGDAALETLDLSALTAPTILTTTASMFSGCSALSTLNLAALALGGAVTTTDMFKNCTALTEITLAKNFVFGTSTGFAFGGTAPTNFWIADINTKMGTTAATWNTYLAALTANATSHTFTLATSTYTLDANGGLFGTSDAATETLSYYGNEGEALGTIATPTHTGWIQNNWWTAATGGSQVTIPSTFPAAASTTVYAHWNRDPNYAEVTFNTNGADQTLAPVYVQKGTAVSAPQTLTRENATFVFWAEDAGLQNQYDFSQAVVADMTLYARWTATNPDTYAVVTFNPNGGSFVGQRLVAKGTSVTRPDNPARENATFDIWCADTNLEEVFNFTSAITQDMTLYARWKAQDPTTYSVVNFNTQGGSFVDSQVVQNGTAAVRPTQDPTKDQATFANWYTTAALTVVFDFSASITQDTTIYAKWIGTTTYTVTFDANGNIFADGTTQRSLMYTEGDPLLAPTDVELPFRETVKGWYTQSQGGEPMPASCTGNATYYLQTNKAPNKVWATLENGVLSFTYGAEPASATHYEVEGPYRPSQPAPWQKDASSITSVTWDTTMQTNELAPTSLAYFFAGLTNLKKAEGLQNLDTSHLVSASHLFAECTNLEEADISSLDTAHLLSMEDAFTGCSSLSALTLKEGQTLPAGTGLLGLQNSENPFWIANIQEALTYNTDEQTSLAHINAYLKSLPAGTTSTIRLASMRLTYEANGGEFVSVKKEGTSLLSQDITDAAYLYGNPGDAIDTTNQGGQDYTPVPVRSGYTYQGYATTRDATVPDTPSIFPDQVTNAGPVYYAVWQENPGPTPPGPAPTPVPTPDDGSDSAGGITPLTGDSARLPLLTTLVAAGVVTLLAGLRHTRKKKAERE